jgi:putative transposase
MRKAYVYRLYPTTSQIQAMTGQLSLACELYNACLEERGEAYRRVGKSLSYLDQANQLKEIRRIRPDLGALNFSMLQGICRRVQRSFENFFRRVKAGETPGYPRFRSVRRFDSITFPSYGDGCKLTGKKLYLQGIGQIKVKLYLQGIGQIKVKLHRPIEGVIKTVTLKRSCGNWYVCCSCDLGDVTPDAATGPAVGIDLGLKAFLVTSEGEQVAAPKLYRKAQARLRRAARRVARRRKGSDRRTKAIRVLAKAQQHIANQRKDFHHKTALGLVRRFGLIAHEDLNLRGIARSSLAKSTHDAGWAGFLAILAHKAAEAGVTVVAVNPRNTTQACSGCGTLPPVRLTLADRVHTCSCGLTLDRDENAARNIRALGLSVQALPWPTGASGA